MKDRELLGLAEKSSRSLDRQNDAMTPLVGEQIQPPPVDAWGAFFEWLDNEVLEGRESFASARRLHEVACAADMDAHIRRYCADFISEMMIGIERSKAPFWAKKWRGQR